MTTTGDRLIPTELRYPLPPEDSLKLSRFVREGYGQQYPATVAFKYPGYWNWLYGSAGTSLVLQEDERIVGHVGCVPFAARQHGRSIQGTWAVDTLVLSEYRRRGYGRRLQSEGLHRHTLFASLWMSPANRRIKESLGQIVAGGVDVLCRPQTQRARSPVGCTIGPPDPAAIADSAEQCLRGWDFFVERSPSYCAWRFGSQPGAGYRQLTCDRGVALIRRCGPERNGEGMVGDAFPAVASEEGLAGLLDAACDQLFSEGCKAVRFGCADQAMSGKLRRRGWIPVARMDLHVPKGTVSGRVFLSLSDHDADQYPW